VLRNYGCGATKEGTTGRRLEAGATVSKSIVCRAVGFGDDHHDAATETAHRGMEHRERRQGGERYVDRIAAPCKNAPV
jgi:hypothetical protein